MLFPSRCRAVAARLCRRGAPFSSKAPPLFEVEREVVKPHLLQEYTRALAEEGPSDDRASFRCVVGRSSSIYNIARFADYADREHKVKARLETKGLATSQARFMLSQTENSIFVEASATLEKNGLPGLATSFDLADRAPPAIFELRTYELVLGYSTVPTFLDLYGAGLRDKLATDKSGQSKLLTLLHSEAGVASLNTVLELWRHESLEGSQVSRAASRAAAKWRTAINDIAAISTRFETQLLRCVR